MFNMNQPDENRPITVPSDANMHPPELLETPQPVIGFLGLDCNRNLTHKSIWDAFNKNDRYRKSGSLTFHIDYRKL